MFDIRDVNYLRFSQKFRYPSKQIAGITLKKGLLYGVCNFFLSFLLSFFRNPLSLKKLVERSGEFVFFYNGRNQYNALIGVYEAIKSAGKAVAMVNNAELPMWRSYVYALCNSVSFWKMLSHSKPEEKKIIANELATFWRSYGDYFLIRKWCYHSKMKFFIVANDHDPLMRSSVQACNDLNIKTAYIQHASVTERFPPLIASYAFLDGIDSLEKYRYNNKKISSKVYLIGGARFDLAIHSSEEDTSNVIGIALTRRDEQCCWERLVDDITSSFPALSIILRPHPRMDKEPIKNYCSAKGIYYSDPMTENSFSFLKHVGLLIANETSTHLDAMIMHRPTVLYVGLSNSGLRDHYGMVKRGLLKWSSDFQDLKQYIAKPSLLTPNTNGVRFFNASYQTRFEFKVSDLIANILMNDGNDIDGIIDKGGIKYIDYEA